MILRHPSEIGGRRLECVSRDEWLMLRKLGVGASESAALFGCGYSNQSPVSIYQDKIYGKLREIEPAMQRRLRIGKQMEPVLRQIFEDETGMPVIDAGEHTMWQHPVHDFMFSTLDGLCFNTETDQWCVAELKNVHHFNGNEWDDGPPLKYAVQVQHQLACTGLQTGYLLGLIGGQEPIVKEIQRNDEFIENALIPKVIEFWQCVEEQRLPIIDASEATKRALSALYPEDRGEEILLPDEFDALDEELSGVKEEIKSKEARKDAIENQIRAAIGDASHGILRSGARYSWRVHERKAYSVAASSSRVLRRHAK